MLVGEWANAVGEKGLYIIAECKVEKKRIK